MDNEELGLCGAWLKEKVGFMGKCDEFNLDMLCLYVYKLPHQRNLRGLYASLAY